MSDQRRILLTREKPCLFKRKQKSQKCRTDPEQGKRTSLSGDRGQMEEADTVCLSSCSLWDLICHNMAAGSQEYHFPEAAPFLTNLYACLLTGLEDRLGGGGNSVGNREEESLKERKSDRMALWQHIRPDSVEGRSFSLGPHSPDFLESPA